jgi:3-isopropylmalate/(R)-2-methylmalate dehydratase small subunit
MKKRVIKHIKSTAIPMSQENIDTDQIVPARFLKATTKEGFGKHLFYDHRFDAQGNPKDFVLNNSLYSGEILIAGKNFGSGSSREHAAWALVDYGVVAVISSFFADIFRNNALNNSLLPIQVSEDFLQQLLDLVHKDPVIALEIDLDKQIVRVPSHHLEHSFEISQYKKICLMNGYDDVDYLLSMRDNIEKFEKKRNDNNI